ncbi:unnamed protein product [Dovyalis caffra]|uniref:Uncharacterized protein n=1 Tax=Dovyalis caffra TaxID=77055 RepID=A0AAV1RT96_9ROSI|nr:unnamed protein product [Dovyalis caffra]
MRTAVNDVYKSISKATTKGYIPSDADRTNQQKQIANHNTRYSDFKLTPGFTRIQQSTGLYKDRIEHMKLINMKKYISNILIASRS